MPYCYGRDLPAAKANTWQAGFRIQPQPVLIRTLRPLSGTPAGKAPLLLPDEKDKAIQSSISFRPCLFACLRLPISSRLRSAFKRSRISIMKLKNNTPNFNDNIHLNHSSHFLLTTTSLQPKKINILSPLAVRTF